MLKSILAFFISIAAFVTADKKSLQQFKWEEQKLKGMAITAIAFDKNNHAWIGTYKDGFIRYTPRIKESIIYGAHNTGIKKGSPIYSVKVDGKGVVWIGTSDNGLVKYDGKKFTSFNRKNSPIPEDFISTIAIDSKDNIWFSSSRAGTGGLVKYDGKTFTVYTPKNSKLPVNLIKSITIDKKDNVWLALSQTVNNPYLVKISGETWTIYGSAELGFSPYYISKISANSKGEIAGSIDYSLSSAMGQERPQVFLFDGKKSSILKTNKTSGTRFLCVDKDDKVWCTDKSIYDGSAWTTFQSSFGSIEVIEQGPDGKMWFGTGDGLYVLSQ